MWFDHSTEGTPVESCLISRVKIFTVDLNDEIILNSEIFPIYSTCTCMYQVCLCWIPSTLSPLFLFFPLPSLFSPILPLHFLFSFLFLLPSFSFLPLSLFSFPLSFLPLPPSFSLLSPSFLPPLLCPSGHETKAMLNNSGPRTKRSKLERAINAEIVSQIVILTILCLTGAIGLSAQLSVVYLLMC